MSQESFTVPPGSHPVLAALEVIEGALKDVAHVDPAFMTTGQKQAALVAHAQVAARLAELGLRVQAAAEDVAAESGHRDVAAWLDHHNRIDRPTARREQRLAEALEQRWRLTQAGMREGVVSLDQAEVITRALDKLPDHIDPEIKIGKNRMHHDVLGDTQALLAAGARLIRRRDADTEPDGAIEWDVLADPEGNEFCVFSLEE